MKSKPTHTRARRFAFLAAIAVALMGSVLATTSLQAQPLDDSFGGFGAAELNVSHRDGVRNIHVASDGSIYVLGYTWLDANLPNILIARYHSDGTLDQTFGGMGGAPAGVVVTDIQLTLNVANGIATTDDGKIMVVSSAGPLGWTLLRYESDGMLDHSFGQSGKQIVGDITGDAPTGMEIINDKIIAWSEKALARFEMDGTLDAGFGINGIVDFDLLYGAETFMRAASFPNGQMYFAGNQESAGGFQPRVFRINNNGDAAVNFGVGGIVDLESFGVVRALVVHGGRITAGMNTTVERVHMNGDPDLEFGEAGVVDLQYGFAITDLILQPNGLTTVSVETNGETQNEFAVARLTASGELDMTFGNDFGWYRYTIEQASQANVKKFFSYANGKVLIVGDYEFPGSGVANILLMRTEELVSDPAFEPVDGGGFQIEQDNDEPFHGFQNGGFGKVIN